MHFSTKNTLKSNRNYTLKHVYIYKKLYLKIRREAFSK